MSCSNYLLHNLKPPVYNCHAEAEREKAVQKIEGILPRIDIDRHSSLSEALEYINQVTGKSLDDFQKVIAVIRHPYTLEYSYYMHLKKPQERERRKDKRLLALADGDFKDFVKHAGYHRKNMTQEKFLQVNDEIPACVKLIRFETLGEDFPAAVSSFLMKDADFPFPHDNSTTYQASFNELLTPEVKQLIYLKHQYMFDSGLYSL